MKVSNMTAMEELREVLNTIELLEEPPEPRDELGKALSVLIRDLKYARAKYLRRVRSAPSVPNTPG